MRDTHGADLDTAGMDADLFFPCTSSENFAELREEYPEKVGDQRSLRSSRHEGEVATGETLFRRDSQDCSYGSSVMLSRRSVLSPVESTLSTTGMPAVSRFHSAG